MGAVTADDCWTVEPLVETDLAPRGGPETCEGHDDE